MAASSCHDWGLDAHTQPNLESKAAAMIRAVERALAIFDVFDVQHQSLSLQEIGVRIGMPKATTFRLVNTLQKRGFLIRHGDQRYSLSLKLLRIAGMVMSTIGVREVARPVMVDINRRTGETVTLNLRSGIERICIDAVETPAPLMHIVRPGERVGLLFGATGRVLLAYCGRAEVDRVIAETLDVSTLNIDELEQSLAQIRSNGYAHTSSQRILGVTAISVPIFDLDDKVRCSLSITGPSIRMDPRLPEFTEIIVQAGADISRLMGGSE